MTTDDVDQLRARVAKLTGRMPRSRDLTYLRGKLCALQEAQRNGEDVHVRTSDEHAVPMSLSMLPSQREAVLKLCDKARLSTSALVRHALAEYAETHGHASIAKALREEA